MAYKCQRCKQEITVAELVADDSDTWSVGELYFHGVCPEKAGEA